MPRFTTFDGLNLAYEIDGDGPNVLLLHGYATDSYINWVRPGITDKLNAAGYRTIALDQRGHGLSDKPHEPSAYADGAMLKDARALIDHLELSALICVGYSMGAMNTLRLITEGGGFGGLPRLENRIRVAVLGGIGAPVLQPREGNDAISEAMLAEDKTTITDPFARSFRDFADLTKADRKALAAIQLRRDSPIDGLSEIAIPVLVLGGDNDPMVGDPQELAAKIPGGKSATVGGSHLNVVNNPEFHRELVGFLDEQRAAVA